MTDSEEKSALTELARMARQLTTKLRSGGWAQDLNELESLAAAFPHEAKEQPGVRLWDTFTELMVAIGQLRLARQTLAAQPPAPWISILIEAGLEACEHFEAAIAEALR